MLGGLLKRDFGSAKVGGGLRGRPTDVGDEIKWLHLSGPF